MPEPSDIPSFAIVGHPNEGKSSVVSTLAEDDQVRISEFPGETVAARAYPVRVDGRDIIRFVDTPGFQHPQQVLDWMRSRAESESNLARACIDAHAARADLAQDLALLEPLAAGDGIIYVVDGSRPVRRHDLAEMEILRLTGNPRMAVINPKEDTASYLEDWKAACARHFNATRTFNAVRATYAERMALLENLKVIHQDWEPALRLAIEAFAADWTRRNARVAGMICDLLRDAVTHVQSRNVFDKRGEETAREELVGDYRRAVARMEARAQEEIRRLYKHNVFHPELPEHSVLREDLFTERTWQLLGLNRRQVLIAAALLGAGAGVQLDLILGHVSMGVFALSGAALAVAAAWLQGENMAKAEVKHLKLGGVQISVGPNRNPQFPFVLLDRLLLYYQLTINWAHARRAAPEIKSEPGVETKLGFTAAWDRSRHKICLDYLNALRKGNRSKQDQTERALQSMLESVLAEISLH